MGEHKGSGLAILCELLAGALTGGWTVQPEHPHGRRHHQQHALGGHRPRRVRRPRAALARGRARWSPISSRPGRAPASTRSWCRASPSGAGARERLAAGIEIDERSWADILAAAQAAGVADARDRRAARLKRDRGDRGQSMERVDCVVIGAGVVGLAVARQLALAGREVIVLEAAGMIGTETSSRNSEVIHAGIYYPTGSLKARSCVAGKHKLYAYCAEHGVPHRALRQADRRHQRGAERDARADPRQGRGQRRRRPRVAGAGRGRGARARGVLHRRRCSRRRPGSSTATA